MFKAKYVNKPYKHAHACFIHAQVNALMNHLTFTQRFICDLAFVQSPVSYKAVYTTAYIYVTTIILSKYDDVRKIKV